MRKAFGNAADKTTVLCGAAEKKHTFEIGPLSNVWFLCSPAAQDTNHQPGPCRSSAHSVKEPFGEYPKHMLAGREKKSEGHSISLFQFFP